MSQASPSLLVVTAPSGAGKTTIVNHLIETFPIFEFSVSATTRQPREGEVHGEDYFFFDHDDFHQAVANNEFVEWEEVYANQFYGTLRKEVERIQNAGKVAIFDIEVNGATSIKNLYRKDALAVYIAPPSLDELRKRLQNRGTESPESIQKRLRRAKEELGRLEDFDLVLLNDDLARSLKLAEKIISKHFPLHSLEAS